MQPDPIGYIGDGPNLYAYVLGDPVNFVDPLGLRWVKACWGVTEEGQEASVKLDCGWRWIEEFGHWFGDWSGVFDTTGTILGGPSSRADEGLIHHAGAAAPPNPTQENQCKGYDTWKAAQDVTGAVSAVTGAVSDGLRNSSAMLSPHGQAVQKGMQLGNFITGVASAGSGLVLGVKYGDWRSAIGGVSGVISGTAVAGAYSRFAKSQGYSNTNISEAIVENIADFFGGSFDAGSSGPCAHQ